MKRHRARTLAGFWILQGAFAFTAGFRSVQMELSSKAPFWGDIVLYAAISAVFTGLALLAAHRVYRRRRGWLILTAIAAGCIGALGLLFGLLLIGMGLAGATDSYILPLGVIAGFAGVTCAGMAWAAWTLLTTPDGADATR